MTCALQIQHNSMQRVLTPASFVNTVVQSAFPIGYFAFLSYENVKAPFDKLWVSFILLFLFEKKIASNFTDSLCLFICLFVLSEYHAKSSQADFYKSFSVS